MTKETKNLVLAVIVNQTGIVDAAVDMLRFEGSSFSCGRLKAYPHGYGKARWIVEHLDEVGCEIFRDQSDALIYTLKKASETIKKSSYAIA